VLYYSTLSTDEKHLQFLKEHKQPTLLSNKIFSQIARSGYILKNT